MHYSTVRFIIDFSNTPLHFSDPQNTPNNLPDDGSIILPLPLRLLVIPKRRIFRRFWIQYPNSRPGINELRHDGMMKFRMSLSRYDPDVF